MIEIREHFQKKTDENSKKKGMTIIIKTKQIPDTDSQNENHLKNKKLVDYDDDEDEELKERKKIKFFTYLITLSGIQKKKTGRRQFG